MRACAFVQIISSRAELGGDRAANQTCPSEAASFALQAVRYGAEICACTGLISAQKGDGSPVTTVDFAVQARVASLLRSRRPSDLLISEENLEAFDELAEDIQENIAILAGMSLTDVRTTLEQGGHHRTKRISKNCENEDQESNFTEADRIESRVWTLDPCDGTKGLIGGESYAVGLARLPSGSQVYPDTAGLALPSRRLILIADNSKLHVFSWLDDGSLYSNEFAPRQNPSAVTRWHFSPASNDRGLPGLPPSSPLCCGSLVKYAEVALGASAALIQSLPQRKANLWDHCPGIAAVHASGGHVTDLQGDRINFECDEGNYLHVKSPGIVASGPGVDHQQYCHAARRGLLGHL